METGGDLCPGGLVLVTPAVEVGKLLAIVFLVFLRVVVVCPDDVLGRLRLRSLRFWGPRRRAKIQRNVLRNESQEFTRSSTP